MSPTRVIADVNDREKTLSVADPDLAERAAAFFADQNVTVEARSGRDRGDVAVLRRGDDVLATVPGDDLRGLVEGGALEGPGPGVDDSAYGSLLSHLTETTFTSYDVEQMHAASWEVEDRALRTDDGTLHAGFQYASMIDAQRERYEELGRSGVDVHVYAYPDRWASLIRGVTVHLREREERTDVWFVVFDGAGDDGLKSALVAEERGHAGGRGDASGGETVREDATGDGPGGRRSFYGFWTYDPAVVDRLCDVVATTGDRRPGSPPLS